MATVAIFDFWENCSFGIYDNMLDVFLGVENIGVDSKSKLSKLANLWDIGHYYY